MGSRAAVTRATIPNITTPGPDFHTIFRTGGTLRRAERRSCQLLQKFSFCDIWPSPGPFDFKAALVRTRDAENQCKGLTERWLLMPNLCDFATAPSIINSGT